MMTATRALVKMAVPASMVSIIIPASAPTIIMEPIVKLT